MPVVGGQSIVRKLRAELRGTPYRIPATATIGAESWFRCPRSERPLRCSAEIVRRRLSLPSFSRILCHAPSSEIPPTIPSSLDPDFRAQFGSGRINLLMRANRVIDVLAVPTAKGDYYITSATNEDRTA